jgi:hypothetical protein
VYYKNNNTTWILTGNIKGPVGPTGVQGITGTVGATGLTGAQGIAGTNGINGTNGQNTLVKTTTEIAGANCNSGGIKIEYGLDTNNNGVLDILEINASLTKYVCNGAVGATGPQGVAGPIGTTGAQGPIGLTGTQGPQGIAGTNGTNGANGQNTLVKTTPESAGSNCSSGGVRIEYGLDANNNGVLDALEINASLTKYVCNGAVGATGPQGVAGPIGLTGTTGPQGLTGLTGPIGATGVQGSIGLTGAQGIPGTIGATGPQGPTGLTGAQGIAGTNGTNGLNGTNGKNTLVNTTTETTGANCSSGGVKIEYGLDANNNSTLDVSEVNASLTKYVCNGLIGLTGATGPAGLQGIQGLTGITGATGSQGPAGSNGTNGLNALIKTTIESAGTNCINGGTKIETGLDANGNGVLDVGEINSSQTKYVCNGGGTNGFNLNNFNYISRSFTTNNNQGWYVVDDFPIVHSSENVQLVFSINKFFQSMSYMCATADLRIEFLDNNNAPITFYYSISSAGDERSQASSLVTSVNYHISDPRTTKIQIWLSTQSVINCRVSLNKYITCGTNYFGWPSMFNWTIYSDILKIE